MEVFWTKFFTAKHLADELENSAFDIRLVDYLKEKLAELELEAAFEPSEAKGMAIGEIEVAVDRWDI